MTEYVKVVYNDCYGGYSLSNKAVDLYEKLSGKKLERSNGYVNYYSISRADPYLVQVVETLGKEASDSYAKLAIEEIPKGSLYRITEYDGQESVETRDTCEWNVAS